MSSALRLAIDIGGTFTDTVLADDQGTIIASTKTLTTHGDPAQGALQGATRVLSESGHAMGQVTGFVHGTTLATNALIEKRGAKVATVTTEGFRDILEIGYERRYSQYDIDIQKPDMLVPRDRAFTVQERMNVAGQVLVPLDEEAIPGLLEQLQSSDIEAVAIGLLHAYANPAHEQRLRDLIAQACPDLSLSISSEVSPEAREFDRLCTTVANAYVQPLMAAYLSSLEDRFRSAGLRSSILMMTASGGMCTLETAARLPIRLVESGPAGGAILAARIARDAGLDQVLSFDMGGTTAKLCLIDEGRPQTSRQFEIARAARFIKGSGLPVRIPVIDMIEIGAGGGSIAKVDRLDRLTVGPESAGSNPGPVAFDHGGQAPTVTDADVVLGYVLPDTFAEGHVGLSPDKAEAAIAIQIGAPLGLDATEAAAGISGIVDENMASAGRMHAVESGKALETRVMIAFGGNGPLHACRVARGAGVRHILIPNHPGVGSAVGFLDAPVSFEIVRSRYSLLQGIDLGGLNRWLATLESEAKAVVKLGAPDVAVDVRRSAFMRYHGQGHEIEISLPSRDLRTDDVAFLVAAFEAEYAKQFSRPVPGMVIEVLNWAVRVATPDLAGCSGRQTPVPRDAEPVDHRTLRCDVTGRDVSAGLFYRADLVPGAILAGPALIVEPQTTTFVGADFHAAMDGMGNLRLTRQEGATHV